MPLHCDFAQAPITSITAILTSSCNLACNYCYASDEARTPRTLSADKGRQAIDFLMDSSGEEREVRVTFFGGEPLLNFPILQEMVQYGEEMAHRRLKKIDFSLTTNGTLLNHDIVTFLDRHEVSLTVSIDGNRQVHDNMRRRVSQDGSYDIIMQGLANLFRYYRRKQPTARITVTNRALDLPNLFGHVSSLGFRRIGMSPVAEFESEYGMDASDLDEYLEGFNKLAGHFLLNARAGGILGFGNLLNLLEEIHRGATKTHSCGAGIGMVTIDPEGKIYTCHRAVGTEAFAMGDIESGMDQARRRSFLEKGSLDVKGHCRRCWARNLCGGGCHYENYHRGGLTAVPPEYVCRFYRAVATTCLRTYATLRENNPSVFSHLTDQSPLSANSSSRPIWARGDGANRTI